MSCGGEAEVEGAGSVCCCLGEVESQGRETEVEGAGPVLMRGRSTLWVVLVWGRKKNENGEGAVRFWRRRERIFIFCGFGSGLVFAG